MDDHTHIVYKVLYYNIEKEHRAYNNQGLEHFRGDCTFMKSSLDLVKGVQNVDKLVAKRAIVHIFVNEITKTNKVIQKLQQPLVSKEKLEEASKKYNQNKLSG